MKPSNRMFRYKNSHGIIVDMAQANAVFVHSQPQMEFLGEIKYEERDIPVVKTRKVMKETFKYETKDGKKKRIPVLKEVEEEYEEMTHDYKEYLDLESTPYSQGIRVRADGTIENRETIVDGKKVSGDYESYRKSFR